MTGGSGYAWSLFTSFSGYDESHETWMNLLTLRVLLYYTVVSQCLLGLQIRPLLLYFIDIEDPSSVVFDG